mmetsp:Transcript_112475/g.323306  ORF Transcript_112475/g.323306 Transcript_112475/m.323306 type:complete len:200 (-) Transcript_112475:68-667(-)
MEGRRCAGFAALPRRPRQEQRGTTVGHGPRRPRRRDLHRHGQRRRRGRGVQQDRPGASAHRVGRLHRGGQRQRRLVQHAPHAAGEHEGEPRDQSPVRFRATRRQGRWPVGAVLEALGRWDDAVCERDLSGQPGALRWPGYQDRGPRRRGRRAAREGCGLARRDPGPRRPVPHRRAIDLTTLGKPSLTCLAPAQASWRSS